MESSYSRDKQYLTKYSEFGTNQTRHQTFKQTSFQDPSIINSYRQSLQSYQKLFPPKTNINTIKIESVVKQVFPLSSSSYYGTQSKQQNKNLKNIQTLRQQYTAIKRSKQQQNESTAINRQRTPNRTAIKSFTETKAKKKLSLNGMIELYSRPTHLEFDLHKQRFFQTFMKRKDDITKMTKSSEKLNTIRRKLILQ